jgi:RpiR family carbohydrate utilization transcriptional regulator
MAHPALIRPTAPLRPRRRAVGETIAMATTGAGNLLHEIASRLPYMAPAMRQIAELVLRDPEAARTLTITELADAAGVADSTVSRFVRELGLDGYRSLRLGIAEATFASRAASPGADTRYVYEGIGRDEAPASVIGKIERSSLEALRQTALRLHPDALKSAVDLIESATVVAFFAQGLSSVAADAGVIRFTRAGKKCLLFHDQSVQVMSATNVDANDVVIGISDSGRTDAIVDAMRLARAHGAGTVAITSAADSPLVEVADVALYTATLPGGGLYGESVTSKWGQLLVMDALYAAYAARRFDETLAHLEETYSAAIQHSRSG